jgi:uncharacterized protein YigE (DUF2233 family)
MKSLPLIALFLLLSLIAARADWTLQQTQQLHSSPAIELVRKTLRDKRQATLHLLIPNPKRTQLKIIDNPRAEKGLAEIMREHGCLAGTNGGFFHRDHTPLGLVVSHGKKLHQFQRAKLLSGLLVVRNGRVSLLRAAQYDPDVRLDHALQAGPFLIDRGKTVRGLNEVAVARRTVVLSDREGRYALLLSSPLSLAELAQILDTPKVVSELKIFRALNLDGGTSSAMWLRAGFSIRETKFVRNFLCVKEK